MEALERIDRICIEFETALKRGERPRIEDSLGKSKEPERSQLLRELVLLDVDYSRRRGDPQTKDAYRARFSSDAALLDTVFPDGETLPETIGKYRVIARLDGGGQADVYRAVHPALEKELVIKLAHERLSDDLGVERLLAEGRVLADLEHPHIARIYDLDLHEGRPFLVMEFFRGRNLRQYTATRSLPTRDAARLLAKVARALHAAHVRGVVHKDVKPSNIVVDEAGEPRLIDFGIAQLQSAWAAGAPAQGAIEGTFCCMAPEQARGETERVGARSDVFGLGAVLYWLLTGSDPFPGKDLTEVLEKARRCEFDRGALVAHHVPSRLRRICLEAMAPEPAERHASADEFARELEAFDAGVSRFRIGALALLGLLVAGVVAALVLLRGGGQEGPDQGQEKRPGYGLSRLEFARDDVLLAAPPLRSNDSLMVTWRIPAGLEPSLFWLDAVGMLHEEKVALVSTTKDGREFRYPPTEGKFMSVAGEPGTEVLFLCAREGKALTRGEIEQIATESGAWPQLPERMLVHFDGERVWSETPDSPGGSTGKGGGGSRGPGTEIAAPKGANEARVRVIGVIENVWFLPPGTPFGIHEQLEIIGTEGAAYVHGGDSNVIIHSRGKVDFPDTIYWPQMHGEPIGALRTEMAHFVDCVVRGVKSTVVTPEEARAAVQALAAAERSAARGKVENVA
jgi:tRNA A-37 threonylcarbamoyl transferase component Bud32